MSAQLASSFGDHLLVAGAEARRVSGESREEVPGTPGLVPHGGRAGIDGRRVCRGRLSRGRGMDADRRCALGRLVGRGRAPRHLGRDGSRRGDPVRPAVGNRVESPGLRPLSRQRRFVRGGLRLPLFPRADVKRALPVVSSRQRRDRREREPLPERSTGAELAVAADSPGSRLHGRATIFWMEIDDAIGNRTLSVTPAVINRRRENLGTIRARGAEADVEARFDRWTVRAGYLYADSTVLSAAAAPELIGLRIPQVPRHQATLRVEYRRGPAAAALQARGAGPAIRGRREPPAAAPLLDGGRLLSHAVSRFVEPYVAVENVLDRDVETGRTPVTTARRAAAVQSGREGQKIGFQVRTEAVPHLCSFDSRSELTAEYRRRLAPAGRSAPSPANSTRPHPWFIVPA